jgi:Skp family chaperone for outer membrane proteins
MKRKDSKTQEENIAIREKGLIIAREFDRVIRTFNKVLEHKDNCAKSMEADLQGMGKSLQENLDSQYEIDRNFELYNNNIEKITLNLQQLESEERTHAGRYERLLKGVGIESDYQEPETSPDAVTSDNDQDSLDNLEQLRNRRESFLKNLNQEFLSLEEKLTSIDKLRKELEDSRNEIREKKAHSLEKKDALEEEGKKLLNEVGRLENDLETTVLEEKNLIEESVKMIQKVESCLELDEKIDHVLFSSLTLAESAETTSDSEPPRNKDQ